MKKNNKVIGAVFMLMFTFLGASSASALGPATVNLGSAGNFVVISKVAISTTGASAITGDIGVSPAAATYITGFSPVMDSSNKYSTSTYVTGKIYASDYTVPTPSYMSTAVSSMEAAYVDAAGRALPDFTNFHAGDLGGQNLVPGLYKFTTGVTIPTNVTFTGGASDVWIIQIDGNLDISSAQSVILAGGASPENIFWVVAGTTTLNTTSVFEGTILAGPGTSTISMKNGAVLNGRALGQKDVTLIANTINGVATIVNPHLIVTKVVINNNGGANVVSDFPLFVGASPVVSGVSNSFISGSYLVSETTKTNYAQSFSGDCNTTGNITLYNGIDMVCTITNDDIAQAISQPSQSSGGGTVVYGCKDPSASNYNAFSASNPSLCTYTGTSSVITPTVTVATPTVVVPKLPKTGFPPQEKWYESLLNNILNLFK